MFAEDTAIDYLAFNVRAVYGDCKGLPRSRARKRWRACGDAGQPALQPAPEPLRGPHVQRCRRRSFAMEESTVQDAVKRGNPVVFMDVTIAGQPIGRLKIVRAASRGAGRSRK